MNKYLTICLVFVLVSASQAAVIFQEDFSGYTEATNPLNAPQVGTWTQNAGYAAVATYHTLLDGTVGPCMEFVDTITGAPTLEAKFTSYTASPIKIKYDFLMRRATAFDDQAFPVFVKANGDIVAYSQLYDANSTQDWISMYGQSPSGINSYLSARDSWYTMEMELPVMPASGTFSMKYTIYDASGTVIYTKDDQTSWSSNAGADPIDELVFVGNGGGSNKTSMLLDNIVVETVPEPATIGLLALGFGLLRRRSQVAART